MQYSIAFTIGLCRFIKNGSCWMNISGIRPVSGFYSTRVADVVTKREEIAPVVSDAPAAKKDEGVSLFISPEGRVKAFGSYDVTKHHRPSEGVKATGIDKAFSQAEVNKAVDVMKRDGSLHKYQTFIKAPDREPLIRRNAIENFSL